jgi:hypothetical protein
MVDKNGVGGSITLTTRICGTANVHEHRHYIAYKLAKCTGMSTPEAECCLQRETRRLSRARQARDQQAASSRNASVSNDSLPIYAATIISNVPGGHIANGQPVSTQRSPSQRLATPASTELQSPPQSTLPPAA